MSIAATSGFLLIFLFFPNSFSNFVHRGVSFIQRFLPLFLFSGFYRFSCSGFYRFSISGVSTFFLIQRFLPLCLYWAMSTAKRCSTASSMQSFKRHLKMDSPRSHFRQAIFARPFLPSHVGGLGRTHPGCFRICCGEQRVRHTSWCIVAAKGQDCAVVGPWSCAYCRRPDVAVSGCRYLFRWRA